MQDDLNSSNKETIKEAVKKVIAAMTVGKDVSILFSHVIKSMGTDNIELKKLVYLYIINYARSQPEKAIMVVNYFQKDATEHMNPLVRALAIRTMGCIRVENITEYLCEPLAAALKDTDPYVRKTAAICVAKLYDINSELVEERGFIESLRDLLSDVNPMVVANAVAALTEISEASGIDYFKIDNSTLSKLLTALNECTEWGRVFILDALSKFNAKPVQARDICDRVVPQLAHANSAVVMAAVKVVIRFLEVLPKKEDVERFCKKLAPPLVTLLSAPPEIQYVALRNIDLIVQKYPRILHNDIRIFFVKYNDAIYVKMQKLEILIKLCSRANIDQVLMEFKEYAQEVDIDFVRRAVRAIGRVAIKLENGAEKCVSVLSDLVKTKVSYVVQESVIVIKDIFRRYPHRYEKIIVTLCDNLESLDEPEAKASMIWIIGEYAERIVDAGDRLEHFLEMFHEEGQMVQLQLLTAIVKLFLKKPDTAKGLVTKVLNMSTEQSDDPDLRDRGYVYWRLLSTDPAAARAVVLAERPIISAETFSLPPDYLAKLLRNISTLASVFHRTPEEFVRGTKSVVFEPYEEDEEPDSSEETESEDESTEESDSEDRRRRKRKSKKSKSKKSNRKRQKSSNRNEIVAEIAPPKDVAPEPLPQIKAQPVQQANILDLFGNNNNNNSNNSNNNNSNSNSNSNRNSNNGARSNSSNNNNGGGLMDDLFGFGDTPGQGNASGAGYGQLAFVVALESAKGLGLQLSVAFKQNTGAPIMVVKCENFSHQVISRLDMKLNKNYLGIQPSGPLRLDCDLNQNETQYCEVPLQLSIDPVPKNPLDTKVQIAVRSARSGSPKPVVSMFAVSVPAQTFFAASPIDRMTFLNTWKGITDQQAQSEKMQALSNPNPVAVKDLLTRHRCSFIAERQIPGRGVSLYFAMKLRGVDVLLEVSIANSGAARVVAKSANNYLAFVGLKTITDVLSP
jgi:vesicle coat complex subunit